MQERRRSSQRETHSRIESLVALREQRLAQILSSPLPAVVSAAAALTEAPSSASETPTQRLRAIVVRRWSD